MEDLSARLSSSFPIRKCSPQLGELAAGLAWARPPPPQEPAGEAPATPGSPPPFWGCGRHRRQYPVPWLRSCPVGLRIAQVMSSLSTPDRDTQLFDGFAPFCGSTAAVEEAAQLLRIIRLLPLLEDKPPPVKAAGAFFIPAAFAW